MKLYIPTSSLNVDNILSTESIAPYSFYPKREFGYQSFFILEEIPFENGILMFNCIPNFFIDDHVRDNYPMIIQLEDDAQFQNISPIAKLGDCSVFFWNKPIHINPTNSQILFFNNKAKALSLENCFDSKMCKLIDFYKFDICAPSNFNLSEIISSIKSVNDSHNQETVNENLHDRAKGFVYGYYIGASNSVSDSSAKLSKIQKRIYDIVASINNNQGQRNLLLEDELKKLDREYESLDPTVSIAKKSWEQFVGNFELPVDKLNLFLKEIGLENKAKIDFCKKEGIVFRKTLSQQIDISAYNLELQRHLRAILKEDKEKSLERTDIKKELDVNPDYELSLLSGTDENSTLFNAILVKIIWGNIIPNFDELRINRLSIATEITKAVKNILESKGQEWQNSEEQLYFHHMRQNIQDFSPFNLEEINNPILKSLVAIVLKGEDFEALLDYLQNNSIADFRYAVAMWGALQGYIRIPRSIFSAFIRNDKLQNLLSDVNEILYRSKLTGELIMPQQKTQIIENVTSPTTEVSTMITDVEKWMNYIRSQAKIAIKGKKHQNELIANLENALVANDYHMDNFLFISALNEFDGWKPTKNGPCAAWRSLQQLICPDYDKRTNNTSKRKEESPSLIKGFWDKGLEYLGIKETEDNQECALSSKKDNKNARKQEVSKSKIVQPTFDFDDSNSIIYNYNARLLLMNCNFLGQYKQKVVTLFDEFIKSYRSGYYYLNPQQYKRNNSDVIDHFCKWCLSDKNRQHIYRNNQTSALMDSLKQYLLNIYHD